MSDTPALIPPNPRIIKALEKLTAMARQGTIRAIFA
tara:strand:+ start:1251 stop:1358 length:108 start_codon:yes stop_codon:yes gene_type:complete